MTFLIDASSLFNLANGEVLEVVLGLPDQSFAICSSVRSEAKSIAALVNTLVDSGRLTTVDDTTIQADEYLALKDTHDLGDGETECIAASLHSDNIVVLDDMAARRVAKELLGENRVTGSIGLLQRCVTTGLLTRDTAYAAYGAMKNKGGFLPDMTIDAMFPA